MLRGYVHIPGQKPFGFWTVSLSFDKAGCAGLHDHQPCHGVFLLCEVLSLHLSPCFYFKQRGLNKPGITCQPMAKVTSQPIVMLWLMHLGAISFAFGLSAAVGLMTLAQDRQMMADAVS